MCWTDVITNYTIEPSELLMLRSRPHCGPHRLHPGPMDGMEARHLAPFFSSNPASAASESR